MAAEPSEDAVQAFREFSSLPEANAIKWLKANGNDANNAGMAWIDGGMAELPPPPRNNDTYNEKLWHADREGNMPQSQMEASEEDWADNGEPAGLINRVPPTRPSSPTFGPVNNPDIAQGDSYEEQIQRAKDMSLSESQNLPTQETGVTYNNQYFGPPTQSNYESEKWAMTIPETNTQEILLNPEPLDRKRSPGAPAFLKPTSTSETLAPFLAILHSIPLAREALLNRHSIIKDYGRGSDWWDGAPIRALRVVNIDEDGQQPQFDDLLHETQRIMAFLDGTERAYGSADALVGLPSFNRIADGMNTAFLATWVKASDTQLEGDSRAKIFQSRGILRPKDKELPDKREEMYCFVLEVKARKLIGKGMSLYEAIDEFIKDNSDEGDTFLDELGDVFMFDITNLTDIGQGLGISVPSIWYADRYLESSIELVAQSRTENEETQKSIEALKARRDLLSTYKTPGSTSTADIGKLMTMLGDYFGAAVAKACDESNSESIERSKKILDQMGQLLGQVQPRIAEVNKTEDLLLERISHASNRFKQPNEDPELSPKHKYLLKGVILKRNSFYVLVPSKEEDQKPELDSPSAPGNQWWRIEYHSTSINPVQTTRVSEKEVLSAASTDSRSAYLVYASEKALTFQSEPLPKPLQNFVLADNRAFQEELASHQSQKEQEMAFQPAQGWPTSQAQQNSWDSAIASPNPHWPGPIQTGEFPAALSPQKRKAKEAAEDSDMEVERDDDSPAMQSDDDEDFISSDSSPLDPTPFDRAGGIPGVRYDSDLQPPMQQRLRPLEPKPALAMGLNGRLPATLQGYEDHDQEMKEIKRD